MATAFALTVDVFAFSIWQIFEQIFHSTFTPIRGSAHHGLHSFDQRLTNERSPVAAGTVDVRDGANLGATRAIVVGARFLINVDVEATVLFLAFAATDTETAHAAFVRNFETGRCRDDGGGDVAFVIQFAMIFETVDNVGNGEPQTLTPFVWWIECRAVGYFFFFNAFCAFFIRLVRVTTAFATTVFLNAIAFGHHLQKFLIRFATPVWDIRTSCASFERFGEHAPTAANDRSWWQIANVAEFGASSAFAFNR